MIRPLLIPIASCLLFGEVSAAPLSESAREPLYQDLGRAITRVFLSAPYPDGGRVLWAAGRTVVAKIDAETFDVIATLRRPGSQTDDSGSRERSLASTDELIAERERTASTPPDPKMRPPASAILGSWPPLSATPPGPAFDAEGRILMPEERAIVAYGDVEPGGRLSGIRVAQRFELPASIPGRLTGLTLTADGHVAAATDAGHIVVLARGFSRLSTVKLPRLSREKASWVSGPVVADDRGGLFVASRDRLHRVAWDGSNLSVDAADGAWSAPVRGGFEPGTTPTLIEAGNDRLIAVLAGLERDALVVMWRDAIPENWSNPGAAGSPRIAAEQRPGGGAPRSAGPAREDSPTDQALSSLAAAGAGLFVSINGSGGPKRLTWDANARTLSSAWTSHAPAPMGGVVFSSDGRRVYYIGRRLGRPALLGLDWESGVIALDRPLASSRFLAQWAVPMLDPPGRYVSGCWYGIMRAGLEP